MNVRCSLWPCEKEKEAQYTPAAVVYLSAEMSWPSVPKLG